MPFPLQIRALHRVSSAWLFPGCPSMHANFRRSTYLLCILLSISCRPLTELEASAEHGSCLSSEVLLVYPENPEQFQAHRKPSGKICGVGDSKIYTLSFLDRTLRFSAQSWPNAAERELSR